MSQVEPAKKYISHFYAEQHVRVKPLTSKWFIQPKVISVTIGSLVLVSTLTAVLIVLTTTIEAKDCGTPATVKDGFYSYTDTTIGSNATYTCRTGWDMIGSPNSYCSPAGWIGSRICQIGDCGPPPNLTDGYPNYTRTTYAAEVIYSCDIGYNLHGNDTSVCQDDDTWNGTRYCEIVDCMEPDNITDGFVAFTLTTYSQNATYTCRTGWDLFGDGYTECSAVGNWTGTRNCTIGNCGSPPVVERGTRNVTATTYLATVEYNCDIGYNLTGDVVAECQDDDSWSGHRTCDIVDCGIPMNISNGYATYDNTTYESIATYVCEAGYDVGGNVEAVCQPDGQWNGTRSCIIRDCRTPLTLLNATYTNTGTTYGETVTYVCDTGFSMSGTATVSCLASGTWDTEPTCIINDCGTPPVVVDGTSTNTGTTYLSTTTYTCNVGHTLAGSATIGCLATSAWEAPPTCDINDCGTPPTVSGSTHTSTGTTYLETTTYTCNTGYTMTSGTPTITCLATSSWEAEPTCTINDCGNPPAVTDGSRTFTTTTYNSVATYSCDIGYNMAGSMSITCQATTLWETAPTCTIKDCGTPPTISDGSRTVTTTTYNSDVTYACNIGYDMTGSATITCQSTGTWDAAPSCTIKDCLSPTGIPSGTVSISTTTYNSIATYSCSTGYTLTGSSTVRCQASGTWEAAPTCGIVDCGSPPTVADTTFTPDPPVTTYNSAVTYICNDPSLTMTPSNTTTCQADGTWSDSGALSCI